MKVKALKNAVLAISDKNVTVSAKFMLDLLGEFVAKYWFLFIRNARNMRGK